MRRIWRLLADHRDLRLLLSAGLISMTGDWVLNIGLVFYVYKLTGSTIASATMLLVALLPSVLLGSFAGVLVDRWDRKTTLMVANLVLAVVLVPAIFVQDAGDVWIIYVIALVSGS